MKIVMTLMVRDEADIVGAMLAHHREQGVDHVLVTDNGSIDGTANILRAFEDEGFVTVWNDPVHRKQQHSTVTKMARHAAVHLGADWVVNADADEFWVGTDSGATVRSVLDEIAATVPFLTVPVINLTGQAAKDGSGLSRLKYRDHRREEDLRRTGIPFHPTADAVHRAHSQVEISQGNHFVSAPGWGEGVVSDAIEVLHLPWRSWRQYKRKVRIAGEAYAANPDLTPSPRHHGMQDYRRLLDDRLLDAYVAKHPSPDELDSFVADGSLVPDDRLSLLAETSPPGYRADELFDPTEERALLASGRKFARLEATADARFLEMRTRAMNAESERDTAIRECDERVARLEEDRDRLAAQLHEAQNRRAARAADRVNAMTRAVLHRPKP